MTMSRSTLHERPSSPASPSNPKRRKLESSTTTALVESNFADNLFDSSRIAAFNADYVTSKPYKHIVLDQLFQDDLLESVSVECVEQLAFTEKETDIYRVHQTGDLASLNYLSPTQKSLLPSLQQLRDALYSPSFRSFLQKVTGCGPLSGSKQDMSVNSYKKGCHLLNHDDVIDSRRVSYILYMPLSKAGERGRHEWKEEWGGSLELYDVESVKGPNGGETTEPLTSPCKKILPAWNQFVFFEVQPGHSFHSVEEVVVGDEEDGIQRLSISGWFHKAQEGEEGYEPEAESKEKSSLEQLTSTPTVTFHEYTSEEPTMPDVPLSPEQISFLSEYINPMYLNPKELEQACEAFADESNISLRGFLCEPLITKLAAALRKDDKDSGYASKPTSDTIIPSHTSGTTQQWKVKGPPHRSRYCIIDTATFEPTSPFHANINSASIMKTLQEQLFPSAAFRTWLGLVTNLVPKRYSVQARRFRPGLDYTLATSEPEESRLDVVLGLTPQDEDGMWESCEWGGWECFMAPDDGDDPAVYGSGSRQPREKPANLNGHNIHNGHNKSVTTDNGHSPKTDLQPEASTSKTEGAEGSNKSSDSEDEEEDGTLLTAPAEMNTLLLVLRDAGVLRFIKYVTAAATGSRWDVSAEYEVGMLAQETESNATQEAEEIVT